MLIHTNWIAGNTLFERVIMFYWFFRLLKLFYSLEAYKHLLCQGKCKKYIRIKYQTKKYSFAFSLCLHGGSHFYWCFYIYLQTNSIAKHSRYNDTMCYFNFRNCSRDKIFDDMFSRWLAMRQCDQAICSDKLQKRVADNKRWMCISAI